VSTVDARRDAYSLLLDRGVIRVGLPWKSTSEFDLVEVDDPHGWASATQLSLFRRPLPTTNLRLATSVSWDGRATIATDPTNIRQALKNQSNGATVNHAQAAPLDDATRVAIVDFETSITTAQIRTDWAFDLDAAGATGGPAAMLTQPFAIGMNDPSGPEFTSAAFSLFDSWRNQTGTSWVNWARRRIAAGQELFNNRKFTVRTANGSFETTCTGCHSLPNAGNSSTARFFDIGVSDPNRRDSRMPLYTFRHKVTGEEVRTTDPGRALITGLWTDMNKFKSPPLRGLAARAPYFHDGSAETIEDVVEFYDDRFDMHLTDGEKSRLGEFLRSL
jgi:hypothetical protein